MAKAGLNDERIQSMLAFFEAAVDATENCLSAEFICPICGETAYALKAECNGHHRGQCNGCGMHFIE